MRTIILEIIIYFLALNKVITLKIMNKDTKLLITYYRYKIISLFVKSNKIVLHFLNLKNITKINLKSKIIIKENEQGLSISPKTFVKDSETQQIIHNDIILYNLKNTVISLKSNFFINKDTNTLYYEKWHEGNGSILNYSTNHIFNNGEKRVKILNLETKKEYHKAIFLGGTFSHNYYHFLLEIISKVKYLERIPNSFDYPILFDDSLKKIKNFQIIIQTFFKNYNLHYLSDQFYYEIEDLWYITSPNTSIPNIDNGNLYLPKYTKIRTDSIMDIRKKFIEQLNCLNCKIEPISKIFIARKSETRGYNQDEIINLVSKYNFKVVFFENLTIYEQVFLLQNADYVVGPSGAAWTNIIFAKENAKGLIWMSEIWGQLSVFSNIANIVSFDLYYFYTEFNSNDFHENYNLNINTFENQLKLLLSK